MSQSSFSKTSHPTTQRLSSRATHYPAPLFILVDHYDSFSHNLKDLLYTASPQSSLRWIYYDDPTLPAVVAHTITQAQPQQSVYVVLSPGPKQPADAPQSLSLFTQFGQHCCFLGICLGHQIMGVVDGYTLQSTAHLNHGGTKTITFEPTCLISTHRFLQFATFATYNSLCLSSTKFTHQPSLKVMAYDEHGEIAALASQSSHPTTSTPIYHLSMQFHPESFLSHAGLYLLEQWLTAPHIFIPNLPHSK